MSTVSVAPCLHRVEDDHTSGLPFICTLDKGHTGAHSDDDTRMTRRGDTCPPWCGGEHQDDRTYDGRPMHPEDQGLMHRRSVDSWDPKYDGSRKPPAVDVWIEEKRYDNDPDADWLEVYADGVHPGSLSEVGLQPVDARRLGEALIRACDIVEGKAVEAVEGSAMTGLIAVSVKTAAALLDLSESTIRDAINKQELPAVRFGSSLRVKAGDLEAWIEAKR